MVHLLVACAAAVWLVFAAAVAGKVFGRGAFRDFRRSLVDTGLVPSRAAAAAAGGIVAAEVSTALLVGIPRTTGSGLALAVVVMTVLTLGVLVVLRRGVRATCRCFGAASTPLTRIHLIRNAIILTIAGTGLLASTVTPGWVGGVSPAVLPAVAAGLVVAVALIRIEDLAALMRPASSRAPQSRAFS